MTNEETTTQTITHDNEAAQRNAFKQWSDHRPDWQNEACYQAYCAGILDQRTMGIRDQRDRSQAMHEDLGTFIQRYLPDDQVFPTEEAMELCSRVLSNAPAFAKPIALSTIENSLERATWNVIDTPDALHPGDRWVESIGALTVESRNFTLYSLNNGQICLELNS